MPPAVGLVQYAAVDAGPAQGRRDVGGDHEHRRARRPRLADRAKRVGRARAGGRQRHAELSGRARVSVGGVGGGLLVAHAHQPDRAAQRVPGAGCARRAARSRPPRPARSSFDDHDRRWCARRRRVGRWPGSRSCAAAVRHRGCIPYRARPPASSAAALLLGLSRHRATGRSDRPGLCTDAPAPSSRRARRRAGAVGMSALERDRAARSGTVRPRSSCAAAARTDAVACGEVGTRASLRVARRRRSAPRSPCASWRTARGATGVRASSPCRRRVGLEPSESPSPLRRARDRRAADRRRLRRSGGERLAPAGQRPIAVAPRPADAAEP